jgi:hypothetical protein
MPRLPRVRMACWFATGGTGIAPSGRVGDGGAEVPADGEGAEPEAGETPRAGGGVVGAPTSAGAGVGAVEPPASVVRRA